MLSWFHTDLGRPDLPLLTLWTVLSVLNFFTILQKVNLSGTSFTLKWLQYACFVSATGFTAR